MGGPLPCLIAGSSSTIGLGHLPRFAKEPVASVDDRSSTSGDTRDGSEAFTIEDCKG